jgi:hypothetical protein
MRPVQGRGLALDTQILGTKLMRGWWHVSSEKSSLGSIVQPLSTRKWLLDFVGAIESCACDDVSGHGEDYVGKVELV